MKCPNCCSPMLIVDETANPKSHVIFYRCSVCSGRHVSAEPVAMAPQATQQRPPGLPATPGVNALTA